MLWMLEQYPQLQKVTLCLDNDEAGYQASERLETQLSEKGYTSERIFSQGKDWNDDLTEARQMRGGFEMKMA
jgi:DNA primase